MTATFGQVNPALTKAIRRVAHSSALNVSYADPHAFEAMDDDGFDLIDVMDCLRRGQAYGPEQHGHEVRCNVVHRGLHIRVVVGTLEAARGNWAQLGKIKVITVMRIP